MHRIATLGDEFVERPLGLGGVNVLPGHSHEAVTSISRKSINNLQVFSAVAVVKAL